jgi:hypothetical protein
VRPWPGQARATRPSAPEWFGWRRCISRGSARVADGVAPGSAPAERDAPPVAPIPSARCRAPRPRTADRAVRERHQTRRQDAPARTSSQATAGRDPPSRRAAHDQRIILLDDAARAAPRRTGMARPPSTAVRRASRVGADTPPICPRAAGTQSCRASRTPRPRRSPAALTRGVPSQKARARVAGPAGADRFGARPLRAAPSSPTAVEDEPNWPAASSCRLQGSGGKASISASTSAAVQAARDRRSQEALRDGRVEEGQELPVVARTWSRPTGFACRPSAPRSDRTAVERAHAAGQHQERVGERRHQRLAPCMPDDPGR